MRPKERVEVRRRKLVEGGRAEQMVSFRCCLPPSPAERGQIVRKRSGCAMNPSQVQSSNSTLVLGQSTKVPSEPDCMNPTLPLPPPRGPAWRPPPREMTCEGQHSFKCWKGFAFEKITSGHIVSQRMTSVRCARHPLIPAMSGCPSLWEQRARDVTSKARSATPTSLVPCSSPNIHSSPKHQNYAHFLNLNFNFVLIMQLRVLLVLSDLE